MQDNFGYVLMILFSAIVCVALCFCILENQKIIKIKLLKIEESVSQIEKPMSQKIRVDGWDCVPVYKMKGE